MKFIVGIDPGLDGAVAFFDPATLDLSVADMPTLKAGTGGKRVVNDDALATLFDTWAREIRHVFVEQVNAMPRQGVTSVFTFGTGFGTIKGILAANFLPRTFVVPVRWKKAMGVPAAKDGAIARANQLLPRHAGQWPLKKHDGRAESALLALYGSQQLGENHEQTGRAARGSIFN